MFKTNFRYTDKIVRGLTQIAAAMELVLNSAEGKGRSLSYVMA